jgi:nitroreductase/NAD-dependent dihydropyrimidine dehydrogenase PreA subunit
MKYAIVINKPACKNCQLCVEVCPNKIFFKNEANEVVIRSERAGLCFKCGQCMAVCQSKSVVITGLSYDTDFFELPGLNQSVLEKSYFDLIYTRRAIRNFKDKPVPKELLEKIVEAISFAPPGFPPLKTKIIVVQNTDVIKGSLPHMIRFYDKLLVMMRNPLYRLFIRKDAGEKKFRVMEEHLVPLLKVRMAALKNGTEDTITRNAPAMILFLADKKGEDISTDISIAATYAMLASHALGLGGSIMDLIPPAINKVTELRTVFGIPDDQEVVSSVIIGYPRYKYQRGIKRSLKSVNWI